MSKIEVGLMAPDFALLDQDEVRIALKDFKGKKGVVLYFYPKAMTPGCTVQACGIRDHFKSFEERGFVVLAVSPDSSSRLKKFEEKQELNFHLLSDEDHVVAESFQSWGKKKFMGREVIGILRSTFVIDKKGKIVHIMRKVTTKTHHEDVLNWIDQNF